MANVSQREEQAQQFGDLAYSTRVLSKVVWMQSIDDSSPSNHVTQLSKLQSLHDKV